MSEFVQIIYELDQVYGFQDANTAMGNGVCNKDAITSQHEYDAVTGTVNHGVHSDNFLATSMIQTDAVTKDKIKTTYVDVVCTVVTDVGQDQATGTSDTLIPKGIYNMEWSDASLGSGNHPIAVMQKEESGQIRLYVTFYKNDLDTSKVVTIRCYYFDN